MRPQAIKGELVLGAPPQPELCRWQFDVVHLWDIPVETAFERRSAGLLALVPLMKGSTPELAERALRLLLALDGSAKVADARIVLLNLAEGKYPELKLKRLVSREQIMSSSLFEEFREEILAEGVAQGVAQGVATGVAQGVAEGRLAAERELCLECVRRDYPDLLGVAGPVIEACTDLDKLKACILASGTVDAAAFSRSLGLKG